jgi:2-methylfumaryl-CoA isomerase
MRADQDAKLVGLKIRLCGYRAMYDLLKGWCVVEGASFIAAPLCGLTFVQLGAKVVRIDPIGGGPDFRRWPLAPDGTSLYWEGLNKGKFSIALDLSHPEGRELAARIATSRGPMAGLLVTNYPANGFLSYEALRKLRADIIVSRVTGSSDGHNALDYTVNCAAGYPDMTGDPMSDKPVNHVLPAWDIAAGLTAAVGMLAAIQRRAQTGTGTEIQVPLSNVAFGTLSTLGNIAEVAINGRDRPRFGNALYGTFGRDFSTSDGHRLMIVAITPRQWTGLVKSLSLESEVADLETRLNVKFASDESARFFYRELLFALVESAVCKRTRDSLVPPFEINAVCWGEYRSVARAIAEDERLSSKNPMFERIRQPSGETYIAAGFPGIVENLSRLPVQPAPLLGANTDEILADILQLQDGEISRLHDQGIVAGSSGSNR